ncbi:MAG: YeeE/YedE family protein [Beijerinckiaceae bacterium]
MPGALVAISGLLVGCAAGFMTRRARLCTFGAFEDAVGSGDWRRLKIFGLALGVALVGAQGLIAAGLLDPAMTAYGQPRLPWLSIILGAFMFGLGMALVGTCAFGSLIRLGGGDLRALVTLLVFGLFAIAWLRGVLVDVRINWIESFQAEVGSPAESLGFPYAGLALAAGIALLLALAVRREKRLRNAKRMLTAAFVLGLCIVAGWAATSLLADPFESTQRPQSLTFVSPVARALFGAFFNAGAWVDFGVMSVAGVALGSFIAALVNDEFHWEAFDDSREMRRHLLGAVLMGSGGVLAGGCTIGQGMTAGSLLSPSWPLAMGGMALGARLGIQLLIEGPLREVVTNRVQRLRESRAFRR